MNDDSIKNAGEIIERFGGIRPMAKKIDVAVTTIQGWKKRDVIPAGRRDQVLAAARTHNIDISDVLSGAPVASSHPANENTVASAPPPRAEPAIPLRADEPAPFVSSSAVPKTPATKVEIDHRFVETEKRAVTKSTWINMVLIVLALGAVAVLLWPDSARNSQNTVRISNLEQDVDGLRGEVDTVKTEQSFLSTLIPKDLDARIAKLQAQAQATQEKLTSALNMAGEASRAVLDENAGTLGDRMEILGEYAAEASARPEMQALLAKFENMRSSITGETQLNKAVSELSALVATYDPGAETAETDISDALAAARDQSTNLSATFEGVQSEDMKAAALLLGMAQFRQSLNRDAMPFADDLALLKNLVGEDSPELQAALDRLAPQAESGVLTPTGLSAEFKTMAGEAVVESLKGEDVSLQDKAMARMNNILAIEKDGELLTGTPEQATMARAQELLDEGDVAGAVAEVEALEGPAAEVAAPWLEKARATLTAQDLKAMLSEGMEAVAAGTSTLIQDEKLGINILRRDGATRPSPDSSTYYGP